MAPLPDLDIQADIADSFAMQRDNAIADRGKHALDLMELTLGDG
jgi:hypothetical protein